MSKKVEEIEISIPPIKIEKGNDNKENACC